MPRLKRPKQELFCQELIKNKGNATQAYKDVYTAGNPANAHKHAYQLTNKPHIQHRITELLERDGITLSRLNGKLGEKLDCKKTMVVGKQTIKVNDNTTQMDAVKTGYKLYGLLQNTTQAPQIDARSINFTVTSGEIAKLRTINAELAQLNDALTVSDTIQTGEVC